MCWVALNGPMGHYETLKAGVWLKDGPKDTVWVDFGPGPVVNVPENACNYSTEAVKRFNSIDSSLTETELRQFRARSLRHISIDSPLGAP